MDFNKFAETMQCIQSFIIHSPAVKKKYVIEHTTHLKPSKIYTQKKKTNKREEEKIPTGNKCTGTLNYTLSFKTKAKL